MKGYNNSNAAYDLSMFERKAAVQDNTITVSTNKSSAAARKFTVKNIIFAVIIAALCAVWVNSYAQLTEATAEIASLNSEYAALESDNDKLNAQYVSKINLSEIQEIAVNEYSMGSLDRSQVSYIALDGVDKAEILAGSSENENIFGQLIKKVLNAIEYLG